MTGSNFPNGFADGVTIRGIPLRQMHPGEVFWVNNSTTLAYGQELKGSDGNDGSFSKPFGSIAYALTQCKANRGDIIALGIGHNDLVASAAAAGLTLNVAGVAIVGTGIGSLMSNITWTLADTTVDITAANISFANIHFEAGFADVAVGIAISAVDGISFDNCIWTEGAAAGTFNFIKFIDIATLASNFSMNRCQMYGRDTNNDEQVDMVALDGLYLSDCIFYNAVAQAGVTGCLVGTDITNIDVKRCYFYNNTDNGKCVAFTGTCSGVFRDCAFGSADGTGFLVIAGIAQDAHFFNCYGTGDAGTFGAPTGGTAIYNNA